MHDTLTGNYEFIAGFRGRLSLIVEYKRAYDPIDDCPESIQTRPQRRHATVNDIIELTRRGVFK